MFRKNPFSVFYHLGKFDDLIQSGFWVIPKFTFANSWKCKPTHSQRCNYSSFIWPFESGNCEKEGKNYKKMNFSKTRKQLFRWKKKHFPSFLKCFLLVICKTLEDIISFKFLTGRFPESFRGSRNVGLRNCF